jgi:phenylpropionate dioxygenase-like ring-hydroxylating dioxygenase large terminal subunit
MAIIDHWHPVCLSQELRKKPLATRIDGHEVVVFRTAAGQIGALDEVCPHRRMRLSYGKVLGDKLQCKYHGWTFGCDGQGESPGTPKLHACATSYETREEYGAVWVRRAGAQTVFPKFELDGYHQMARLQHRVKAPLEVTVDNFTEIEHTPTTHGLFGYPLEKMPEVKVTFEPTEKSVRTINVGPSKPVPLYLRVLMGITPEYLFVDDWTTYFSPVYTMFNHEWEHPISKRRGRIGWRLFIVWTPLANNETQVTTFAYGRSTYPGPQGGLRMFRWLMRRLLNVEIGLDVAILEGLASYDTSLEGMKLSRFDRALGLNRDRIQTLYRGDKSLPLAMAG